MHFRIRKVSPFEREIQHPLAQNTEVNDRSQWLDWLHAIAVPVISHAASGTLKESMPVSAPHGARRQRDHVSHLEACGRTLAGIAPWLDLARTSSEESSMQKVAQDATRGMLGSITNPESPDYLNFVDDRQPLVDAAFLAQGLLRSPIKIWEELSDDVKANIATCLASTRKIQPYFNNWILFSGMVEAFMCKIGEPFDQLRIEMALRNFDEWYVGDGFYGDGATFRFDYYNSYVIHPFLIDIASTTRESVDYSDWSYEKYVLRAKRYVALLGRMISPSGHMPVIGRSLSYRFGNLHAMAQLALRGDLPDEMSPSATRSAMTSVMSLFFGRTEMFDSAGWLNVGFIGNQPSLAEDYISTGSLYMLSLAFLPLGLAESDQFWSSPREMHVNEKIYAGLENPPDRALDDLIR